MKEFYKFISQIAVIAAILGALSFLVNHYIIQLNLSLIGLTLLFLFAVSGGLFYFTLIGLIKKPKKFAQRLMISMSIKLFASIMLFSILAYLNRDIIISITVWYLSFYIVFHIHFISVLNKLNKKNS